MHQIGAGCVVDVEASPPQSAAMSKGRQTFKQADMTKAIKAAQKAGLAIARVEISADGTITVIAGKAAAGQDDEETSASLRKLL